MNPVTTRPISILIAALGGEGGGVLSEWLVEAATAAGFPVQGTSIPGVAQRTGATTYYIEIFPVAIAALAGRRPVLSLTPVPGRVDLVIASEPLEAARLAQAGLIDPGHTTVICSSERTLTNLEKMAMGDERHDAAELEATVRELARRYVAVPMQALAKSGKTLTSAVMFGALAGTGQLPFDVRFCEDVIRAGGRAAKASLAGFVLGRAALAEAKATGVPEPLTSRPVPPQWSVARAAHYPEALRAVLEVALARLADYQDQGYVALYLGRVDALLALERRLDPSSERGYALTREAARFLALWMCFEDLVRVADLKSRRTRFARVRSEVHASPGASVRVTDYFKPRLEEAASLLPQRLARRLVALGASRRGRTGLALRVRADGLIGLMMLRTLAALRPLRRHGERYALEQERITRWLGAIEGLAAHGWESAHEMALCGRLVKGYGETNRRAHANLERIIATFQGTTLDSAALAAALRAAREAALADPEGRALDQSIEPHGMPARAPRVQPVVFVRSGKFG